MFNKILIANRGAIACRIIRTLRRMGIQSVAVYSEADRHSLHVSQADESVCIGTRSYIEIDRILEAAKQKGAEAIHPGYGFLSENADFAEACETAGLRFIGPTPSQMRAFGLKHRARELAEGAKVPLLPGTGLLDSLNDARLAASLIGYPVMLKATGGGGGIGMRLCFDESQLVEGYEAVQRLGQFNFGTAGVYLEKFVESARHIEVQVFGDGRGQVIALGERDCSVQRRNQKVIEETPAPGLSDATRNALFSAAVSLCRSVAYRSAGTVEFIYDDSNGDFYFLEVNARLQVEHGVTEEVTGIDLVEWMVRAAAGELLDLQQPMSKGCAIQVRLYAEDPGRNFQPCAGTLTQVELPSTVRVETAVKPGSEISPFYDPMIAKVIVVGSERADAAARMQSALAETRLYGIETNLEYLKTITRDEAWLKGGVTTAYLNTFEYKRDTLVVHEPGTQTTVQDYPGRPGYWHVGVPPSGPMDSLSFRLVNRIVGNADDAAALEITFTGPTLEFTADAVIALGGPVENPSVPLWTAVNVRAGTVLSLGPVKGRAYLAIRGGLDVPEYLGSKSTFILGKFGGHAGRTLRTGDVLHVGDAVCREVETAGIAPTYGTEWTIAVQYGPHGAPDFFTDEDIEVFFTTVWKVHYNSDRTGVRLIGPKPRWARKDGGEAGLHPSNIHDNAYAVGTVDFTGDMPVLLGPDGPSLGGFVCPATVIQADIWKMGQLKPGDTVRFCAVSNTQAGVMEEELEKAIVTLKDPLPFLPEQPQREPAVVRSHRDVVCRADGDKYLLVEFGPNVLDLNLRVRVHALEERLRAASLPGILDVTPGIRSLHLHYNSRELSREALLDAVDEAERSIPDLDDITLPSRVLHLPLSWDDPATRLAIQKYMQSVRPDAPWCPSNIEFIRRINGLESIDDVYRIVFDASYLVMGLGDVYLGAPVATPVDPRHRLVTTKYNPARTWTPENAVGIGGAYLCVYGMEGPGGYQFVGRTLQMWNTYGGEIPWLLRFFDQIRFYPVSSSELLEIREAFPHGKFDLKIEDTAFSIREHHRFLESIRPEAAAFKSMQQAAFTAERERWAAAGQPETVEMITGSEASVVNAEVPDGWHPVRSPITASVWNVAVEPGQRVQAGQRLLVLEAMKMEVAVAAPEAGVVEQLHCAPGAMVTAGQNLVLLRPEAA